MMINKKRAITVIIIVLAAILAAAGYILLPEVVVTQVSFAGGSPTTMPKLLAVALPFGLSVIFALSYNHKGEGKNLIVAIVGLAVLAVMLIVNLI